MPTINTYDELLDFAATCLDVSKDIEGIEIGSGLNYEIVICGPSWSGDIDYRLAKYITELQHAVNKVFRETCGEDLPDYRDRIIVKIKVTDGSLKALVKIDEFLKALFENMESRHKLSLGVVVVTACVGYFSYNTYSGIVEKQMSLAATEGQQQRLERMFNKVADKLPDAERPARALVSKMGEQDKIKLPGYGHALTVEQAKEVYPRKARSKISNSYIDGLYIIKAIKFEDPLRITVEKGAHRFECFVSLNDEDLGILYEKAKGLQTGGGEFEMELKINAKHTDKEVKEATVYGLGEKRTQAKELASLILN